MGQKYGPDSNQHNELSDAQAEIRRLEKELKRKVYSARDDARSDIFDYIEKFYNNKRKHDFNDLLAPVEYEKRYQERLRSV